jgi:hypothetical protein
MPSGAELLVGAAFAVLAIPTADCGPPGLWISYLGGFDPSGPNDPPGIYDEFVACQAATQPRLLLGLLMLGLAVVLAVGAVATSVGRHRVGP